MGDGHKLHPAAVAVTSDEARSGRTDGEWAIAREPEQARLLNAALLESGEASPDSLAPAFGAAYRALSRRDWEFNTILIHPDHLFEAADANRSFPDMHGRYEGVADYITAVSELIAVYPDARVELGGVIDVTDTRIVALTRWSGRAARSGLALEWEGMGDHEFRDGLMIRQTYWWNVQHGMEQLGLSPLERPRS